MSNFVPELKDVWVDGPSLSPDGKILFWREGDRGKADIYWIANPLFNRKMPEFPLP